MALMNVVARLIVPPDNCRVVALQEWRVSGPALIRFLTLQRADSITAFCYLMSEINNTQEVDGRYVCEVL
jgi:hypothetical protein